MPPIAGDEVAHLLGALDRMRATFRWKADGLDATALGHRIGASEMTIGGLLNHLARVEDEASTARLDGSPIDPMWVNDAGAHDPEFAAAADLEPDELYRRYDDGVAIARARFRTAIAANGLDGPTAMSFAEGQSLSVRRLLFDLLEEHGRHTGHVDLLREAIDGRVGEDPPADWEPFTGGA